MKNQKVLQKNILNYDEYQKFFIDSSLNQSNVRRPDSFNRIGLLRHALKANIYEHKQFFKELQKLNFRDENIDKEGDMCRNNINEIHEELLNASGIQLK